MFRPMRRSGQQLTREECIQLLEAQPRGILSLAGENGYPYGLPMNHWFNGSDGCLYFHGGRQGHKLDAIRSCPKASFCLLDQGFRREGEWALNIRSVIVFGRIEILTDHSQALAMVRQLGLKYFPHPADAEKEVTASGGSVLVFRLVPEHISGKLVNES